MATIASLNVLLGMNTRGFSRGAKNARTQLGALRSAAATAAKAVGLVTAAFVATAGIRRGIQAIKTAAEELDSLAKAASRLELTASQLGGLQFAAERFGATTVQLRKGLEIFLRRIGEVRLGVGQAKRALETLGLDATTLATMSLDEAFKTVAQRLSELEVNADRAAAANFLFGRGALELANLLNSGREGIEELEQRFILLGGAISQQAAADAEELVDSFTNLNVATKGLRNVIVGEAGPALKQLVDGTTELVVAAGDLIRVFKDTGLTELASLFAGLSKSAAGLLGFWLNLRDLLQETGLVDFEARRLAAAEEFQALTEAQTQELERQSALAKQLAEQEKQRADAAKFIQGLQNDIQFFGFEGVDRQLREMIQRGELADEEIRQINFLIGQLKALQDARDAEAAAQKRQAEAAKEAARAAQQAADEQRREADAVRAAVRTPAEKFNDEIAGLQALLRAGAIDERTFARAAAQAVNESFPKIEGKQTPRFSLGAPEALERGSAAAFSAVNQANRQNDPVVRALNQQLRNDEDARRRDELRNRLLGQIAAGDAPQLVGDIP